MIRELVEQHGAENILFLAPTRPVRTYFGLISVTSSGDDPIILPCTIDESRYMVSDNYKITLKPNLHKRFATNHYYISDLESLIRRGDVDIFVRVYEDEVVV